MLVALDHLVAPLRNIAFIEVLHLAKVLDDLELVETELAAIVTHLNARSFEKNKAQGAPLHLPHHSP